MISRRLEDYSSGTSGSTPAGNDALGITASVISNLLLFLLVFGMSATVDVRCMKTQLKNYRALATGLFCQFVILPFLGFITVKAFDLPAATGITLLVITSSPGGSYSNWWCSLFNADLALSVAMTAISTILSVFFLPLNLLIYATTTYRDVETESGESILEALNFGLLLVTVALVVVAIAGGLYCSARINNPKFHGYANLGGNIAGIALILFSLSIAMFGGGEKDFEELEGEPSEFYISTALPCLLGLVIANIITVIVNLKPPERVTAAVECCYQNTGIATSVAITMFDGADLQEAILVPLWYGIVGAVVLGLYLIGAWKCGWTKAPRNERFCKVIATSYEIISEEDEYSKGEQDQNGDTIEKEREPPLEEAVSKESKVDPKSEDGDEIENGQEWPLEEATNEENKADPTESEVESDITASNR